MSAKVIDRRGFSIVAKTKEAEIWIYEEIGAGGWFEGGLSAKQFAEDLKALGKLERILVHINSPGGDVFDGIAIYNILKQNSARVAVTIDGLAASIASVIAMAGDEISMAENALMMIHDPWSIGIGNSAELREVADRLDKVGGVLTDTYARKTGLEPAQIAEMMALETWMTAAEAQAQGFVDTVGEPLQMAAHFDLAKYKFHNYPGGGRHPEAPGEPGGRHPEPREDDKGPGIPPDLSCFDQAITRCESILRGKP